MMTQQIYTGNESAVVSARTALASPRPPPQTLYVSMPRPRYLNVVPDRMMIFPAPYHKCQCVDVYLMNFCSVRVGFKLKTTSPDLFYCNPFAGFIEPGTQTKCAIGLRSSDSDRLVRNQLHKQHSFMVYAYPAGEKADQNLTAEHFWARPVRLIDLQTKKLLVKFTPNLSIDDFHKNGVIDEPLVEMSKRDAATQDYETPKNTGSHRISRERSSSLSSVSDSDKKALIKLTKDDFAFKDKFQTVENRLAKVENDSATLQRQLDKIDEDRAKRHRDQSTMMQELRTPQSDSNDTLLVAAPDSRNSPSSIMRRTTPPVPPPPPKETGRLITPYAASMNLVHSPRSNAYVKNQQTRSLSTPSSGSRATLTRYQNNTSHPMSVQINDDNNRTDSYYTKSVEVEKYTQEVTEAIPFNKDNIDDLLHLNNNMKIFEHEARPNSAPVVLHKARMAKVSPPESMKSFERETIKETYEYRFLPYDDNKETDRSVYETTVKV